MLLAGSLLLAVACGTNRDIIEGDAATPRATATSATTASPTATPAPAPDPIRTPLPMPTPLPLTPIQGLFTDPRSVVIVDREALPPLPTATVGLDSNTRIDDTILFDIDTQTATNLGRGFRGEFSPDGTRMTWVRITPEPAGEVRLIDLSTGEEQRLGSGVDSAPWIDNATVLSVNEMANARIAINVTTGVTGPAPKFDPANEPFVSEIQGDLQLVQISDTLPAVYEVRDRSSGAMQLRFEAESATLAPDGALIIATPATDPDLESNIFLVDVDAATATFVASTTLEARPLIALSATPTLVAWTHRYCATDSSARVFNRVTLEVSEVTGAGWAVLTPENLLALGEFGARALLDTTDLTYTAVLPTPQTRVNWSPDYRYASVGAQLEEGSRCP